MHRCSAIALLDAIRNDREVETDIAIVEQSDGERLWMAIAIDRDGQIWRSLHSDLLLAVVMLERMLTMAPLCR